MNSLRNLYNYINDAIPNLTANETIDVLFNNRPNLHYNNDYDLILLNINNYISRIEYDISDMLSTKEDIIFILKYLFIKNKIKLDYIYSNYYKNYQYFISLSDSDKVTHILEEYFNLPNRYCDLQHSIIDLDILSNDILIKNNIKILCKL